MGFARKDLTAVGSTLELILSEEEVNYATLQYINGAAGTVVLEGIASQNLTDQADAANWQIISMTKPDTTVVASLAAAGIGYALAPYARIRARKTVGIASCIVSLGIQSL